MNRLIVPGLVLVVCTAASAQQATEVYIPIGESPGVSESESVIGEISSIDYGAYRMQISTAAGTRAVTMNPKTRYYYDNSNSQQRSVAVGFKACSVGQRIEAYLDDNGVAIWVKIAAAE